MIIAKKSQLSVYAYLFKHGTIVVPNDEKFAEHKAVPVNNLQVKCLLKSLLSRGFVHKTYSWRKLYYSLTDEGVDYLRATLHLASSAVPLTLLTPKAHDEEAEPTLAREETPKDVRAAPKTVGAPSNFEPEFGA